MSKKRLQGAVTSGLTQLYDLTSQYSENEGRNTPNDASKRRLAAAAAASVIGASLDRFKSSDTSNGEKSAPSSSSGNATGTYNNYSDNTSDGDMDSFWQEEDWEGQWSTEERRQKRKMEKQKSHFVDLFFEKMLEHALPQGIPAREQLEDRITDPLRKQTDPLSISKFVRNLMKLTEKLGGLFQAQYFFLRIFHWTQPALTLSAMMLYTLTVLHPSILIISPLLFLLYGIMVPGYIYRHPVHRPRLLKTRERGKSLLENITRLDDDDDDADQLKDFIEQSRLEKTKEEQQNTMRDTIVPELETEVSTKYVVVQKNMEFFVNMRDVQNIMTEVLKVWSEGEKFWYGTAGFKDERSSTSLFFTVFVLVVALIISGPYIPWTLLMIVNGWIMIIAIHPKVSKKLLELNKRLQVPKKELDKIVKESERKDIIIDDEPDIREVEIFEIWRKSFTTNEWEFYLFSNQTFDHTNSYRKSQTPPPGTLTIAEVTCPKSWRFDDASWNIDYDCYEWCHNRGFKMTKESFVDVNNEFLVDEQFKRRRLYRNVIRYSKPARKPAHLL